MRIRSIKPEFWRSADTADLDMFTRLLFVGLWNYVDDNGVGEDDIHLIRSDLFPRDRNVDELSEKIHGALIELSSRGQITRYRHLKSGRRYFHIIAWHHQRINRPTESKKPLPTCEDCEPVEESSNPHGGLTEDSLPDLGSKGSREQGAREKETCATKLRDHPLPPRFEEFWDTYPRHRDRRKGEKAYANALKRADPDTIIAGALRYSQDPNRVEQFTKYAEGWLNGDGWLDDPLPPRNGHTAIATSDRRVAEVQALKHTSPVGLALE